MERACKRKYMMWLWRKLKLLAILLVFIYITLTIRTLIQSKSVFQPYFGLTTETHDNVVGPETYYVSNITKLKERMVSNPYNLTVVEVKTGNKTVTLIPSKPQRVAGSPVDKVRRLSLRSGFKYPLNINLREAVQVKLMNGSNIIKERPINPHNFNYIHRPAPCNFSSSAARPLLILVKSAAVNTGLRDGVRRTWGNVNGPDIRVVFLLGKNFTDEHLQKVVNNEAKMFGDIVQENFVDVYVNNTFKTIMGFNWAAENCPGAKVNYFVDDDYLVLLPNILHLIRSTSEKNLENMFVGLLVPHSRPFSNKKSKWYVPVEEYQYDFWVPYLAGGAFLVSRSVLRRFQFVFPYVKYLRIDDSYLGIVAYKIGVKPQSNSMFNYARGSINLNNKPRWYSSHGFKNIVTLEKYWKTLMAFLKK